MKFTLVIILILLILLSQNVLAANIQGVIYDFSLEKINNSIIEINTQPLQRHISQDGTYSFNVPNGEYTIISKTKNNEILASENITISSEGNYTLDLISFTDLEEEIELLNDSNLELEDLTTLDENSSILPKLIIVILIILISVILILKRKNKTNPEKEDLDYDLSDKVFKIIKTEKRVSQKELRKRFPYSEAKISLVLTELEAKGKIEKIKKGRSNIIILKK